jgi:hypothetical protein
VNTRSQRLIGQTETKTNLLDSFAALMTLLENPLVTFPPAMFSGISILDWTIVIGIAGLSATE